MGKSCTCCIKNKCICNSFVKEISIDFFGKDLSIPIGKTIKEMGCVEYFYIGDATYEPNFKSTFRSQTLKYTFDSFYGEFKKNPLKNSAIVNKYFQIEIKPSDSTVSIDIPDERLVTENSTIIYLDYYKNGNFIETVNFYTGSIFAISPELKQYKFNATSKPLLRGTSLNIQKKIAAKATHVFSGGIHGEKFAIPSASMGFQKRSMCGTCSSCGRNNGDCYTTECIDGRHGVFRGAGTKCLTFEPHNIEWEQGVIENITGIFILLDFTAKDALQITIYKTKEYFSSIPFDEEPGGELFGKLLLGNTNVKFNSNYAGCACRECYSPKQRWADRGIFLTSDCINFNESNPNGATPIFR